MAAEVFQDKYIGTVLDSRYEITKKIGEGGMAVVYRASDTRLSRDVAVKIMRDELFLDVDSRDRFYAEAHSVAMLSHPNIVSIFDVNSDITGAEYIVMELLDGVTLRQYIDKMRPIPWKQVLHFSIQICDALSHAHSKGIIHRDIKPQNIMLLPNGTLKVADFGIAAIENQLDENTGEAMGSLNYIAPEQLRGAPASPKTDIYSLGIVMYEMLTGFKPYSGNSPSDVLMKLGTDRILPVRAFEQNIPQVFERIVEKAMQSDSALRFANADELLAALNGFASAVSSGATVKNEDSAAEKPIPAPKQVEVEVSRKIRLPSKKEYIKSITRANRIAFSIGTFFLLLAAFAFCVFLWNYWLHDIFSPAERVEMPNLVGYGYESVISNVELAERYRFKIDFAVDTESAPGTILSQDPAPGRSLMLSEDGIEVHLSVSTGYVMLDVIDVAGIDYREAMLLLQNAGFSVEINNVTSPDVQKDIVVSTSPAAGEQLAAGSTVYVNVSGGQSISYVQVPNVVGLNEDVAVMKLESAGFACAGTIRQQSDFDPGTVIGQSIVAFAEAEEHSGITLTVSSGPW